MAIRVGRGTAQAAFEIVFSFLKFWRGTVVEEPGDISLSQGQLKELNYPVDDEVALRVKITVAAEKEAAKKEVKSTRRPLIIPL